MVDNFVVLVDAVAEKCFNGRVPEDTTRFVAAMLCSFPCLESQPQPVLDFFALGLVEAIHALRESQNSNWKN